MIFETKYNTIIYCKDDYNKECDNEEFNYNEFFDKCYYRGYVMHRDDGPAIEWGDGSKSWYFEGNRHRENGPAIEWDNGDKGWWLKGERCTEEEYWKIINLIKNKRKILNEI
jgi:hypothetical protein